MKTDVKVKTPENIEAKVSRDKVVVQDRNLVSVSKNNIRCLIGKDQLDDWKSFGWKTKEDLKKEAEMGMEKIKNASNEV